MAFKDKWKSEKLTSEYDKDDTYDMTYDDSPLLGIIKTAAIVAGGYAAYKSGMLKIGIKKSLEYAERFNGRTTEALKTLRKWTIKDEKIPAESLIRSKLRKLDFIKDNEYRKRVMNNTLEDIKDLQETVRANIKNLTNEARKISERQYGDTELSYTIGEFNKVIEGINYKASKGTKQVREKMIDSIYKHNSQSDAQIYTQNKRTGFKKLTLGDVLEVKIQSNKPYIEYKDYTNFRLDNQTENKVLDFIKNIDSTGKHIYENDKFKKLVIDNSLLIDNKGKIVDLRAATNSFKFYADILTNDFAIPFVKINPLAMYDTEYLYQRKTRFGVLHSSTIQNAITGKAGRVTLGEHFGNDIPLVAIDGNIFKFNDKFKLENVSKGNTFTLVDIPTDVKSEYELPRRVNAIRKMYGLSAKEFTGAPKKGEKGHFLYKILKSMDIGFQDNQLKSFSMFDTESWLSLVGRAADKIPRYDKVKHYKMNEMFGEVPKGQRQFVVYKNTITPLKAFKDTGSVTETFKSMVKQTFAGRKNIKDITYVSTIPYFLMERLNESIAPFGLGLSNESIGSVGDVFKNLLVKRFLPVYLGVNAIQYSNMLTTDKDGENMTTKMTKGIGYMDLGYHRVKDALHITKVAKYFSQLTPGADQIGGVPGMNLLHLTYTADEQLRYLNHGMDPVRKGRWWGLGNTAFSGDKIEYWQPNLYRRMRSDYKFTNTMYGSRKEYFDNFAFPTPTAPLSPIRYFFTDKNHYDKKHYYDRPYLMTSPMFENVPIIGHTLSATIGKIIKPPKLMHPEYWRGETDDKGKVKKVSIMQGYTKGANYQFESTGKMLATGVINGNGTGETNFDNPSDQPEYKVYETSSGNTKLVDIGKNKISYVRQRLKKESIKKVEGTNVPKTVGDEGVVQKNIIAPNLKTSMKEQYRVLADVGGMYGFNVLAFVTGMPNAGTTQIDTSSYAYSINRSFWDENIGGLGKDLSEIFRRFVPKRRKDIEYFNPVRNTMPNWMPGSDYFTNFKEGDPYLKVGGHGEIRLPGEAYEKIHHLKNPYELEIGPSMIGKNKQDLIKHFLGEDTITDEGIKKILRNGTRVHEKLQKDWLKRGIAIDVEAEIYDPVHHVAGRYDAAIHDPNSPTGVSIVDFKTISARGWKNLKAPKEENVKQLNYYLYATKNKTGYLYYINRDKEEQIKIFKVNYNHKLLNDTLLNLQQARGEVRDALRRGEIHRGDLYDVFDRYRILADTAPYSKEFKELNVLISKMDLKPEQEIEAKEIRRRVKMQNEHLRIYPYRFRTASVVNEKVHVTKVIDANTFLTKEHPNNPIRLAGVRVSNNKSDQNAAYARTKVHQFIYEGATLNIGVSSDKLNMVSNDTLKTIHAVVYSHGTNVNRYLIKNNYGKENKNDYTSTGVYARFSSGERAFGKMWELIAHNNTFLNTKFLQVRSARESYERRELYGYDFSKWERPVHDYLQPAIYQAVNGPFGLLTGGVIGYMFAKSKSKFGKIVGTSLGVATVAAGKMYKHLYQAKHNEKWIPEERRKERRLNEYMDMLKYLKYTRLYNVYAERALKEDRYDIRKFIGSQNTQGKNRKKRLERLTEIKRLIKIEGNDKRMKRYVKDSNLKYLEKFNKGILNKVRHFIFGYNKDETIKAINLERNEILGYRNIFNMPKNAIKALEYYNKKKQTMYAYEPGDPIENALVGMPKKDRMYMKYFMKAPKSEKMKILEEVPRYMRRPLESIWHMPVENKVNLEKYFTEHALPGANWSGWREDKDLEDLKVKMIKHEALDFSNFNVWRDDVDKARQSGSMPLPKMNFRQGAHEIRAKLKNLLGEYGLNDVRVDISNRSTDCNISLNLNRDREDDIIEKINNMDIK